MARAKPAETNAIEPEDDFDIDTSGGEVIAAAVDLRSKVKERKLQRGEKDPVAAAEAALKRMETTFVVWIKDEIDTLLSAWRKAESAGFEDGPRDELFRATHDLKGQAATLGYPAAGRVAGSLCLLLEHAGPAQRIPAALVGQHVQGIRAIVAEDARENPVADRLADRLEEVTKDYLESLRTAA